ncbi:MAG TPA: GWxTD domain-containing protein [Gemmatimonadales bacterium]|nr:GWxTD domain-containing protein [Gemmatimonadales bacterium]
MRFLLLLLTAAAAATVAAAQSPDDRAAIERLRDSLESTTDSVALKRLEASTIEVAKVNRDDPLIHLRLGFIAYRLGEIADASSHFDDAAGEFEWASQIKPEWPYPWFGLGRSELAIGAHSAIAVENLKQVLHLDHLSKAINAYAKAVATDSTFAEPVIELVDAALRQRVRAETDVALRVARLSASAARGNPAFQMARGRIEREVGEGDSARAAFAAFLAAGGDSGVGLLELARTDYFLHRDSAGRVEYFAGAREAGSVAAIRMYRTDFSWIAKPEELGQFDSLRTPAARARWLEAFWARRDVADVLQPGQRLAEHYRRWFYAMRTFGLLSPHRHYDFTEVYRSTQDQIDDRGVVFMRLGPPDQSRTYAASGGSAASGVEPNESWLYRRPEGDLIFHFVSRGDVQDFKLVESLTDALSFQDRQRLAMGGDTSGVVRGLFGSRATFGPMYERIGSTLTSNVLPAIAEDRQRGTYAIGVGTTTDDDRPRFDVSFDPAIEEYLVGTRGTGADSAPGQMLHLVFAIPGDHLTPVTGSGEFLYPLRFRLYVSNLQDSLVGAVDTLRVFGSPQALRNPSYLSGQLELPVPAGEYRYRLLIESRDRATGSLVSDTFATPRLDGRTFAVSDLVLGEAGGLSWSEPGDTVYVSPLDRFPAGSDAQLYYEVYGLPAGAVYHTEIRVERTGGGSIFGAIRRLFGGNRPPVQLSFDVASEGTTTRVHRAVALRDAATGSYNLTLRITDPATGRALTRVRHVEVVSAK